MLCSFAALTVSVVESPNEFIAAAIVVVPCFLVAATPFDPIVAMVTSLELQVTEFVMSCVEPSEYVPVAVNCCALPAGCDGFFGEIVKPCSAAATALAMVPPVEPPNVAEIVAEPDVAFAVTRPVVLTVATDVLLDAHVAVVVTFSVVPSLNTAVADICCVSPPGIDGFSGEIMIDVTTAADVVKVTDVFIEPTAAERMVVPCADAETTPDVLTCATPVCELE
jgi:hypothetical protein